MVKKVLKFSAEWCVPCKLYSKTFHEVSNNDLFKNIIFENVDIEENDDLTEKYKIRSVPTTILLDENDNVLFTIHGNVSKNMLIEEINNLNNEKCNS